MAKSPMQTSHTAREFTGPLPVGRHLRGKARVGKKFDLTRRDRAVEHDVSGYPNPRHRLTPLANDPFVDLWIAPGRCARSLTRRGRSWSTSRYRALSRAVGVR